MDGDVITHPFLLRLRISLNLTHFYDTRHLVDFVHEPRAEGQGPAFDVEDGNDVDIDVKTKNTTS